MEVKHVPQFLFVILFLFEILLTWFYEVDIVLLWFDVYMFYIRIVVFFVL